MSDRGPIYWGLVEKEGIFTELTTIDITSHIVYNTKFGELAQLVRATES